MANPHDPLSAAQCPSAAFESSGPSTQSVTNPESHSSESPFQADHLTAAPPSFGGVRSAAAVFFSEHEGRFAAGEVGLEDGDFFADLLNSDTAPTDEWGCSASHNPVAASAAISAPVSAPTSVPNHAASDVTADAASNYAVSSAPALAPASAPAPNPNSALNPNSAPNSAPNRALDSATYCIPTPGPNPATNSAHNSALNTGTGPAPTPAPSAAYSPNPTYYPAPSPACGPHSTPDSVFCPKAAPNLAYAVPALRPISDPSPALNCISSPALSHSPPPNLAHVQPDFATGTNIVPRCHRVSSPSPHSPCPSTKGHTPTCNNTASGGPLIGDALPQHPTPHAGPQGTLQSAVGVQAHSGCTDRRASAITVPALEDVDMEVLHSLPPDIQKEVVEMYSRNTPGVSPAGAATRPAKRKKTSAASMPSTQHSLRSLWGQSKGR